jgi:hypothetical protein
MEVRRLAARGQLVKITRGRYALPLRSRLRTRPTAPESVITQLNLEGAQQLVSSAAAAPPADAPPCAAAPGMGSPALR